MCISLQAYTFQHVQCSNMYVCTKENACIFQRFYFYSCLAVTNHSKHSSHYYKKKMYDLKEIWNKATVFFLQNRVMITILTKYGKNLLLLSLYY